MSFGKVMVVGVTGVKEFKVVEQIDTLDIRRVSSFVNGHSVGNHFGKSFVGQNSFGFLRNVEVCNFDIIFILVLFAVVIIRFRTANNGKQREYACTKCVNCLFHFCLFLNCIVVIDFTKV